MSGEADIDAEQVVDDIRSQLSVPESGTIRRDVRVYAPSPSSDTACVGIQAGIPMHLLREIANEAEERVDLRRRGKVGEVIVDLDDETWELKIEGDSV